MSTPDKNGEWSKRDTLLALVRAVRKKYERSPGMTNSDFSDEALAMFEAALSATRPPCEAQCQREECHIKGSCADETLLTPECDNADKNVIGLDAAAKAVYWRTMARSLERSAARSALSDGKAE